MAHDHLAPSLPQYQTPYNTLSLVPISLTLLGDAPVKLPENILFDIRNFKHLGGES